MGDNSPHPAALLDGGIEAAAKTVVGFSKDFRPPSVRPSLSGETIMSHEQIQACIAACAACTRECTQFCEAHRADGGMLICVTSCRDCADLCELCIRGLENGSRVVQALCLACAAACELCVAEFRVHHHETCRQCADACEICAGECRKLLALFERTGRQTLPQAGTK
jgi:hypothetical protein